MKCPRPTLATHFLKLGGAAFFLIFAAFPRAATAQSVTATITASPNPYHTDDDITLDVEGDWDSETSNWPCDMDWEDGGCAPTMHTFYVYGSNGFFDNWSEDDDLASTGWDDAELTDTGSEGDSDSITYTVDLDVEYCDEFYSDCWDVTTEGGDTAQPAAALVITSSSGSDLYNFDGNATDPNCPTSISLSIGGGFGGSGSDISWSVSDPSTVTLSADYGLEVNVTANAGAASGSYQDLRITASDGDYSADFYITVRRPASVVPDGNPASYSCPPPGNDWGYRSEYHWKVLDSIGDPLPYGSSISDYETWTDPYPVVDYRGGINSGWDMPVANGVNGSSATDSYSHIVDQLGINGHQAPMTWDPAVSCSLTAAVDHWGQNWYVAGILVLHDTLFRFQDHEEADQ